MATVGRSRNYSSDWFSIFVSHSSNDRNDARLVDANMSSEHPRRTDVDRQ
jgi:hypothetical protein